MYTAEFLVYELKYTCTPPTYHLQVDPICHLFFFSLWLSRVVEKLSIY